MKKIALVLVLSIAMMSAVMAAPSLNIKGTKTVTSKGSFGAGLNVGNNTTGLGLRAGLGNVDLVTNVGISILELAPAVDVTANVKVYTLDFGRNAKFPISLGAGAYFSTGKNLKGANAGVLGVVSIEYNFKQISDAPISAYFRLEPALKIAENSEVNVGFAPMAALGAYWQF